MPLASVLLPVYQPHPELFPRAVQSVLDQTLADLELVIIEDPSLRPAAELLAPFVDSRIRHIANRQRTSFVSQLNQGLRECRADWIARMDADDLCHPDRLAQQLAFVTAHPQIDVLGSQLEVIDEAGRTLGCRAYPLEHAQIVAALRRYCALAHPATLLRKSAVLAAGGYRDTFGDEVADYDLWCRLAARGATLGNHPRPLLRYRVHAQGMKRARLRAMLCGTIAVKHHHFRGQLALADRCRLLGERILLSLPDILVLKLFSYLTYRKPSPLAGAT